MRRRGSELSLKIKVPKLCEIVFWYLSNQIKVIMDFLQYCEALDTCAGHYGCTAEGERVCSPGYTGLPDCTTRDWDVSVLGPDPQCPDGSTCNFGYCYNQLCCCDDGESYLVSLCKKTSLKIVMMVSCLHHVLQ